MTPPAADHGYTSALAAELAPGLLERFTRYVRFDTEARRDRDSCPSSPGQLELGRALVGELREIGLADADIDENGYVMATLPANVDAAPTINRLAHLATRLSDLGETESKQLINWGYAICDRCVRTHYNAAEIQGKPAPRWPYAKVPLG